ncbi:hypothetical protein AAY473_039753 [Plecturocebus cupreus]
MHHAFNGSRRQLLLTSSSTPLHPTPACHLLRPNTREAWLDLPTKGRPGNRMRLHLKKKKERNVTEELERLGDSRQRRHMGRQRDSFGRSGASRCRVYGTGCPFSRARPVPSPQGEQQLEALKTESKHR